jgi:hypothetical protein
VAEARAMARRKANGPKLDRFTWLLAAHSSRLERVPGFVERDLQRGKERNVRLAARLLDGLVIEPSQIFSHHHAIGRPTRRRGFVRGLELRDGHASAGVGGGLCQVSNSVLLDRRSKRHEDRRAPPPWARPVPGLAAAGVPAILVRTRTRPSTARRATLPIGSSAS